MLLDAIIQKYPRTIKAMQKAACLSTYEAAAAIRDYKRGDKYSGEAVNHFGGIRAVLFWAWKRRHN